MAGRQGVLGSGTVLRVGEILAVCTGSTGKAELSPALPCLGTIRPSPAWKFVLNILKGSKKGYRKVKATFLPLGRLVKYCPPSIPPFFSCLKCLTQLRLSPQESTLTLLSFVSWRSPSKRKTSLEATAIQNGSGLWLWAAHNWSMETPTAMRSSSLPALSLQEPHWASRDGEGPAGASQGSGQPPCQGSRVTWGS